MVAILITQYVVIVADLCARGSGGSLLYPYEERTMMLRDFDICAVCALVLVGLFIA